MTAEYKQSPIGKIPKEWGVIRLGKASSRAIEMLAGYAFSSEYFNEKEGIPLIRIRDLGKDCTEALYNGPYDDEYLVRPGDILISMDGEFKAYIWRGPRGLLNQRVLKVWSRNEDYLNNLYLHYTLQKPLRIIESQVGQTTVKHLSTKHFDRVAIPLPPIEEQRKIAELLSSVDEAIQNVDKGIAKTERLKKGLMQKLLTEGIGHKEFKETEIGKIPKEWKVAKLREVAEINRENRNPRKDAPNKKFLYIDIDSVEGETGKIREPKEIVGKDAPSRARRLVHTNDVIMSTVRPYLKAFAVIPEEYDDQICSTGFAVLTCKKDVMPHYLLYTIFSDTVINQCNKMMVGAQYPALNVSHVSRIKIALPSIEEQQKIAAILSTVDYKLELDRKRKTKLERVKKGLMKDLLTGKKRVEVAVKNAYVH